MTTKPRSPWQPASFPWLAGLAVALLLFGTPAAAAVEVSGRLVDGAGRAAAAARLELVAALPCRPWAAPTEAREVPIAPAGDFEAALPGPGPWLLRATDARGRVLVRSLPPRVESVHLGRIPLVHGPTVEVTARNLEGAPLPGLALRLEDQGRGWRREVESDGQGRLALPARWRENDIEAKGHRIVARGPDEIRLQPEPAADPVLRLSGRVVEGATGRPLPGALVWAADQPDCRAVAGGDGTFTLIVPAGASPRLWAAAGGYRRAAGRGDGGDLALTAAARPLVGWIVDHQGRPLEDVDVEWRESRGEVAWTVSDARGAFELAGLPRRPSLPIELTATGFLPAREIADMTSEEAPEWVLWRPWEVRGRIVDGAGRPVPQARWELEGEAGFLQRGETGVQGEFLLSGLRAGDYHLSAEGVEGLAGEWRWALPAGEGIWPLGPLELVSPLVVAGRVVDEAGDPLAGVEILRLPRDAAPPTGASGRPEGKTLARSDGSGYFSFRDSAGRSLAAWRSGYETEPFEADPDAAHEVVLRAGRRLAGEVRGGYGPVAGARVKVAALGAALRRQGTTDRDGRFAIDSLPAGLEVEVLVAAEGFALHREVFLLAEQPEPLRIELEAEAVVWGRVTATDGSPLAGVEIRSLQTGGAVTADKMTISDAAGEFRLSRLAVGEARLALSASGYESHQVEVALSAGEQWVEVELEGKDLFPIRGRVVGAGGRAVGPLDLELLAAGGGRSRHAVSDVAGDFSFPEVPAGDYRLFLAGSGWVPRPESAALRVAGAIDGWVVEVDEPCSLAGVLEGLSAAEMAAAQVIAQNEGRRRSAQIQRATGEFRFPPLASGSWQVSLVAAGAVLAGGDVSCRAGESTFLELRSAR